MNPYVSIVREALTDVPPGPWMDALAAFVPRPRMTVSQWADAYRVLPAISAEPGRWRTGRIPYLKGILDAASDPDIQQVVIMAGSQTGKTECLLNIIGYYMHQSPGPILVVQASEKAMRDFAKERIAPLIALSPALQPLVSEVAKDQDSTILSKQFPGGGLWGAWASSAAQLASRAIQLLIADELDRWPAETIGSDGDPWAQAVQRTTTFGSRRKIIPVSSPTIEGQSRIEALYKNSDRRRYYVPCPHCGATQPLEWPRLIYKNSDGIVDLDGVHYCCAHCQGKIFEHHKPAMIAAGDWVAENPGHEVAGFHVSGLLSAWMTWRELAELWVQAIETRDENAKRAFHNLKLGNTWKERAAQITIEQLDSHREPYPSQVPDGVNFLTCGVDTQDARLEAQIIGWGEHRESWAIAYAILLGNTDDLGPHGPWAALDNLLARAWTKADGKSLRVRCAFVDAGGHRTPTVHRWTAERANRWIYSCHGVGGEKTICGKPTTTTLRSWSFPIGVDEAKSALYSRLALDSPGPGFVHFPDDTEVGFDSEYFKGLLSEHLVFEKGKRYWDRKHRRNEPLDTFVYATAAMEYVVMNYPSALTEAMIDPTRPSAAPKRRVLSKGVGW